MGKYQTTNTTKGGLVDRYINTSYDIVVLVANNLDWLTNIASGINSGQLATIESYINGGQIDDAIAAAVSTAADAAATAADVITVAGIYDQFDDRYLGSKTSDPSLDNDGNALLDGSLYWNSITAEMRVYNGATWQVAYTGSYVSISDGAATGVYATITDNSIALGSGGAAQQANWDSANGDVFMIGDVTAIYDWVSSYYTHNAVWNGTGWEYAITGYASYFRMGSDGAFHFHVAASGTAATGITFDEVLTITNNGNVYSFGPNQIVGNTAFGLNVFSSTVSGSNNTGFGYNAASGLTTGARNVIVGQDALTTIGVTNDTIAIGYQAAQNSTASINASIFIGSYAGQNANSAGTGIFIGASAGKNANGNNCIFLGNLAGGVGTQSTASNNIGIGVNSLEDLTSGTDNVAIGSTTGRNITIGQQNVFIGSEAGDGGISGTGNIAIGYRALTSNVNPLGAVAIGHQALFANSADYTVGIGYGAGISTGSQPGNTFVGGLSGYEQTGSYNTFIGQEAGEGVFISSTGDNNVAVGYQAFTAFTTSIQNVVIGSKAGLVVSNGYDNVMIGYQALSVATGPFESVAIGANCATAGQMSQSVAIGKFAMAAGSNHNYSVAIGYNALPGVVSVNYVRNVAIGHSSLTSCQGDYNVAIGADSAKGLTTGDYNTALGNGVSPLFYLNTGVNNTLVGNGAELSASGVSNQIVLGNANITAFRCQVALTVVSDERDKANIIDSNIGLDFISRLNPVTYNNFPRGADLDPELRIGLIAQEVKDVMDELDIDFPGFKSHRDGEQLELTYQDFIPPMINAIKELKTQLEALRS